MYSPDKLNVYSFGCAKSGLEPHESQDGIFPRPGEACFREDSSIEGSNYKLYSAAVADGATQSYHPGLWARGLAETFHQLDQRPKSSETAWNTWIDKRREDWQHKLRTQSPPTSAFDEVLRRNSQPAAATFAGLRLYEMADSSKWWWDAWVLGDSCLFHLRADQQVQTVPIQHSQDFGSNPQTTLSYDSKSSYLARYLTHDGRPFPASQGDVFFLATDAMAQWMMKAHEKGKPVWATLLSGIQDLNELVGLARVDPELKMTEDDVSLVVAVIGKPHPWIMECLYKPTHVLPAQPSPPSAPFKVDFGSSEREAPKPGQAFKPAQGGSGEYVSILEASSLLKPPPVPSFGGQAPPPPQSPVSDEDSRSRGGVSLLDKIQVFAISLILLVGIIYLAYKIDYLDLQVKVLRTRVGALSGNPPPPVPSQTKPGPSLTNDVALADVAPLPSPTEPAEELDPSPSAGKKTAESGKKKKAAKKPGKPLENKQETAAKPGEPQKPVPEKPAQEKPAGDGQPAAAAPEPPAGTEDKPNQQKD